MVITADDGEAFVNRLGDEEAVERIAMMIREARKFVDMVEGDREELERAGGDFGGDHLSHGPGDGQLADTELDLHFPRRNQA